MRSRSWARTASASGFEGKMASPAAAPPPAAFGSTAPFLAKAPEFSIPMRHFVFALAAFWVFAAAFARGAFGERLLGFDFEALWALGLVHTLTLGWIAMTLFGAMCQMAPVLWETSLASPGAAKAAWWLFASGTAGFVGCLWAGVERYWIPAVLLAGGAALYLFVLARTMISARRLDWTGKHLALALGYLAALAALGLLLAYDRHQGRLFSDPEGVLVAHIHLALVGWVSLSIIGVSYRLVAMFSLSHLDSKTPGRLALALINAGLLGLAVDALFLGRRRLGLWACVLAAGYLAYAFQMRRLFRERARRIDPALAYTLSALAGGSVWAALGVSLALGWLPDETDTRAAYVFCALLGWATPFILGQIHKIIPFLVWLHVYSKQWKPPAPLPKITDLTSERLAWAELALFVPGVYAGVAGFLFRSYLPLRVSSVLLLGAATLYAVNAAVSLRHVLRKDPRWTAPK